MIIQTTQLYNSRMLLACQFARNTIQWVEIFQVFELEAKEVCSWRWWRRLFVWEKETQLGNLN